MVPMHWQWLALMAAYMAFLSFVGMVSALRERRERARGSSRSALAGRAAEGISLGALASIQRWSTEAAERRYPLPFYVQDPTVAQIRHYNESIVHRREYARERWLRGVRLLAFWAMRGSP